MRLRKTLIVIVIVLTGWTLPRPVLAACAEFAVAFQSAVKAGDVETFLARFEDIESSPDCPDSLRAEAKRIAARGLVKAANTNDDPRVRRALLERSLEVGAVWQAAAMLADLESERGRFEAASGLYQKALDLINDPIATPKEPNTATIEGLFNRAAESQLLAKNYVPVSTHHRSGEPGGLASTGIRGFVPTKVPLPVTFVTDSAEFAPKGAAAVEDLLSYLKAQGGGGQLVLIGHTDERGTNDYNMQLSLARAEAVQDFLLANGLNARIEIEGRGEEEPLQVDDPERYSVEERWQLDRRVELKR